MSDAALPGAAAERATPMVRAWDLPTRLFHWALVVCIVSAWASFEFADRIGDPTLKWHRWNGMAILVLLTWRLLWGFAGGSTARFAAFITWPWNGLSYLVGALKGDKRHYLGHNPAGTWMVIILFLAVAAQAKLGLYTLEHNELTAGPLQRTIIENETLTKQIQGWHRQGFYLLLGLIAVHVTVNLLYRIVFKDKLIEAMVTGRKPASVYADQQEATGGSLALAAALLIVAAFIVYGAITMLGGRIL
jgi:cytochrome b